MKIKQDFPDERKSSWTLLKCGKRITKTHLKFYKIKGHSHPQICYIVEQTIFPAKSFITFFTFSKGPKAFCLSQTSRFHCRYGSRLPKAERRLVEVGIKILLKVGSERDQVVPEADKGRSNWSEQASERRSD